MRAGELKRLVGLLALGGVAALWLPRTGISAEQDAPVTVADKDDSVQCENSGNKACELVQMNADEYEALYKRSETGPIPVGPSHGAARMGILPTGFLGIFWTGKHFFAPDAEHPKHWLKNFVIFGEAVTAEVDYGVSKADPSKRSIILDYQHSDHLLARHIRDEIRQVPGQPGVYIGYAYKWFPFAGWVKALPFALDFNARRAEAPANAATVSSDQIQER